jgi:hypothetical protein
MCRVSTKIKFCTCSASSPEKLKHYWVFHRFIEGKDVMVIGEPVMPFDIDRETNSFNRELLLHRVNEPDAFDINLYPKENDRLQISFLCKNDVGGYIHYGFSFRNGNWAEEMFDGLEWMWHHSEIAFGKIKQALSK